MFPELRIDQIIGLVVRWIEFDPDCPKKATHERTIDRFL